MPRSPFLLLLSRFSRREREASVRRENECPPPGSGAKAGELPPRGWGWGVGDPPGSATTPLSRPLAGRGASPAAAGAGRWGREPQPGALMSPCGGRRAGSRLGQEFRYAAGPGGGAGGGRATRRGAQRAPRPGEVGGHRGGAGASFLWVFRPSLDWRARVESALVCGNSSRGGGAAKPTEWRGLSGEAP